MAQQKFHSLFISAFFLFAGYGLFLNSAGVKLAQMGVGSITIGLLNTAFFAGASMCAIAAHRIISRVGHIRSFAVFGAVFAMSALGHTMVENLWIWGFLRVLLGFCYFSLLMIAESWFTERSEISARAKVLATYNGVYYIAFTAGIALLSLKLSSSNVFALSAILVMASMLPVTLTKTSEPAIPPQQRISLPRVMAIAPLALVASFLAGVMVNGFFTMSSVFLLNLGLSVQQVSLGLSLAMAGGFISQWPVAKLSDKFGRRNVILGCAIFSATVASCAVAYTHFARRSALPHYITAFCFGIGLFTLYALSLARANDVLPNNMSTVEVSRSILFSYGLGSLTAPMVLGVAMSQLPVSGFYSTYIIAAAVLAFFAWLHKPVPQDERSVFVNMVSTSSVMAGLDPRNNDASDLPFSATAAQAHVDQSHAETAAETVQVVSKFTNESGQKPGAYDEKP